jgi:hypothetical protein
MLGRKRYPQILLLILILLFFSAQNSTLFAAGDMSADKPSAPSGNRSYIGINADAGLAYASGEAYDGYESGTAFAFGIGISGGLEVMKSGMIVLGLGYEYRPVPLTYNNYGYNYKIRTKQHFLTFNASWRFLFRNFYSDLGAFYGIKLGHGFYEISGDVHDSGNLEPDEGHRPFGAIIGIGYLVKSSDRTMIDIGLKYKPEINYQFEFADMKLRSNTLCFSLGLEYNL